MNESPNRPWTLIGTKHFTWKRTVKIVDPCYKIIKESTPSLHNLIELHSRQKYLSKQRYKATLCSIMTCTHERTRNNELYITSIVAGCYSIKICKICSWIASTTYLLTTKLNNHTTLILIAKYLFHVNQPVAECFRFLFCLMEIQYEAIKFSLTYSV